MLKRIIMILFIVLLINLPTNFAYAQSFIDVEQNNMGNAINNLAEKGIIQGFPDGTFGVTKQMNRAEFCAIITKFVGADEESLMSSSTTHFNDLKGYSWAIPYISYCNEKGYITGDGKDNVMPGRVITYNEICTILVRVMGFEEEANEETKLYNYKYPQNYVNVGKRIGIFDSIILNDGEKAIRGIAAVLVNNAYKFKEPNSYSLINTIKTGDYENTKALLEGGIAINDSYFELLKTLRDYSYNANNYVKLAEYAKLEDLLEAFKTKENIEIGKAVEPYELSEYFNVFYNELNTPMMNLNFEYEINENSYSFNPYDLEVNIIPQYCVMPYYDLKYSITVSQQDKEETIEILRNFSKNIYLITASACPDKKIYGGFFDSWYKYPNLKVGLETNRAFTWKNFTGDVFGEDYSSSNKTNFQWYSDYDDYVF